ncbi:hypothetical protein ElyMa_004990800 [Elysia marginata]|uniref:Secreted protein n=1 Tax=Elysia marginata TaxID=1093978 RepID=A0AAV4J701_9GAST|nr:hypothetical protein ElyMa_004990800 [Elysia marginata]
MLPRCSFFLMRRSYDSDSFCSPPISCLINVEISPQLTEFQNVSVKWATVWTLILLVTRCSPSALVHCPADSAVDVFIRAGQASLWKQLPKQDAARSGG